MKKIYIITIAILSCLSILFLYALSTAFDPEYDKAEIVQNIGGTLICNSVYMPDIHSSPNQISYLYKVDDRIIDLGYGSYTHRLWKKDEQLIKFGNWIILKTGGLSESDKLIVGNMNIDKWVEYEFTPENIENEAIWKAAKINSLLNYCCTETYIDKIQNGNIELHYKYRKSETITDKYEVRKIYYSIDNNTGKPIMVKIN